MRFLLYTSSFAGLFVGWSCMSGSALEITAVSSVTAGPYPKLPDVVECAPEYGENLNTHACDIALKAMPDGRQFSQFVSRKSYPGQEALITPVYYYDNTTHPSEASCVITVDLAGRSNTDNNVYIRKSTLRELVGKVNASCIIDNFGRGGFITYKLKNTITGISKYKKVPAGYNTPLFLTVQVSPRQGRGRPGDTDPRVNKAVQNGLLDLVPQMVLKVNRAKVFVIVNALKEVYTRMRIGGTQAWWDSRNITDAIPENVDYNCYGSEASPRPRDCEDASFTFIGEGNVIVGPKEPLIKQVGNCKIEVSSRQRHACTWDVLRATIDVLLATCLDGPQAVGLGGIASAQPFDENDSARLPRRQSIEYQNMTELGVGPPLPPTFEIEISKARPLQSAPLCDGDSGAVKKINGCIGYQDSLIHSNGSNASLVLTSHQTGAVASLRPIAVD